MSRTIFKTFSCLLIVLSFYSHARAADRAGIDLSLMAGARSYPLAGSAEGQLGAYWVAWGRMVESPKTVSDIQYGYVRGFLGGGGAPSFAEHTVGVEVFPISILGVRARVTNMENHDDLKDYDCVLYECRLATSESAVEGVLSAGFGSIVMQATYTALEAKSEDDLISDFIYPAAGLALSMAETTELSRTRALLGYRLSDAWMVSAIWLKYEIENTTRMGQASEQLTGNLHYSTKNLHIFLGAGSFESELKSSDLTVFGGLKYELLPNPGL